MENFFSRRIFPGVLLVLLSASLVAQEDADQSDRQRKSVDVVKTTLMPILDGNLDDAVWQEATRIIDLHQVEPVDHGEPSKETVFYITYDENYFYMAARLYDDEPELISARQMVQGQSLFFDDTVDILLDTFNNGRTAFYFQTNPNGIRSDGVWENPGSYNGDWDGIWQVAANIDAEGWTAEFAIPFTTLNFDPNTSDWGFNVGRSISRNNEDIYWSSFNRRKNPATAGRVSGIGDIEQGLGLDIVPSVTVAQNEDYVAGASDNRVDPSLDVFYKFTPNLTGVLTMNTDFSATEVDDRQVNLTRFSLFFPEKRDFFLQDSEIFSFGGLSSGNGLPFYSRRIGLSSATGQPVDIDVGGKVAGRVGNVSIGALAVQQGDTATLQGQDVFVGRVTANVLDESKIGAIFTEGNPNSETDNALAGVDFAYRNTQFTDIHTFTGDFWYQQTDTSGMEGDDKAYSMDLSIDTQNTGISGSMDYSYIGAQYNPALGFANRRGVETLGLSTSSRYYADDRPILRYIYSQLSFSHTRVIATEEMQSGSITFTPLSFNTHLGDRYNVQFIREREGLDTPFSIRSGIIIPTGKYSFDKIQLNLQAANQRRLSPDLQYEIGDFFDGEREYIDMAVDWRPNRNISLDLSYQYTDVDLPQGDFISRLISVDASYAFDARWSWVNLLQYDNGSGSMGLNSRLHWSPQAGEDFYLVINYNFDSSYGAFRELNSQDSEFVLKYTRNFRF